MQWEDQSKTFDEKTKALNHKIKNFKQTKPFEIEKIVYSKVDAFTKLIEANDVFEQDLSNSDNQMFNKLTRISKERI